jgi:hypothetical protein
VATQNKPTLTTLFTSVVAGIKKHLTGKMTVGGVAYTPVSLAAVFLAAIKAIQTADSSHTQWLDDVEAMNKAVAQAEAVFKALKQFVLGQFGANKTVLGDFGLEAPKSTATASTATKAAAALKAKATKEARGSNLGKRQKKAVKGSVEVEITSVPVVTSPVSAAPTANGGSATQTAAGATPSAKPSGSGS